MSKTEKKSLISVVFQTMGWPVFWGMLTTVGFYTLIHQKVIDNDLTQRYFTGHPVEYIEATLFFIGMVALFMKAIHIIGQFGSMSEVDVTPRSDDGQPLDEVPSMLDSLAELPGYVRQSYLVRRLQTALAFVRRKGDASGLDQELKHQSDLDVARQHEGYALVRIIIWATPMLGFLGTVIGITLALGDLSPQSLVDTPEQAMEGLLAGLSVAFDTTALALTLSIVLMFCQFVTNRLETELLEAVDARVDRELVGRFADVGGSHDPNVATIRKMNVAVLESVQKLVQRQAEIWESSLVSSQDRWDEILKSAGMNIESSMESAFRNSIRLHAEELARNEEQSLSRTDRRWEQLQKVLTENAQVMQSQQVELVKQGDLMLQSINATGEVTKLQHALNENMRSLSLMGKFDETIMSLSGAISLLNARLGASEATRNVRLHTPDDDRRAAA